MTRLRVLTLATLLLAQAGCEDDPLKSRMPGVPPPPSQGVQAFIQVDNEEAQPGEQVSVVVWVQFGSETTAKLGSYTGRLLFDPEYLSLTSEVQINDGLRVTNPNGAAGGEIRFAGAAAQGLTDLRIYQGVFAVKRAGYLDGLRLQMEELSAALTLTDLEPQLEVPGQVFVRETPR